MSMRTTSMILEQHIASGEVRYLEEFDWGCSYEDDEVLNAFVLLEAISIYTRANQVFGSRR